MASPRGEFSCPGFYRRFYGTKEEDLGRTKEWRKRKRRRKRGIEEESVAYEENVEEDCVCDLILDRLEWRGFRGDTEGRGIHRRKDDVM